MIIYQYTLAFIFGLTFGSFANVLIYRIPEKLDFIFTRSACPSCKTPIAMFDNIPLLSYLILGGKCRHCKNPISARYPLVELLTGILFFLTVFIFGYSLNSLFIMSMLFVLLVLTFIDIDTMLVPNGLVLLGSAIAIIRILIIKLPYISMVSGAALFSGVLILTALLGKLLYKKDSMGGGDIKLALFLGLMLGFKYSVLALFLSFIIAAIILMSLRLIKKVDFGQEVPFVPFLVVGSVLSLLWGELILEYYFKLL